MSIILYIYYIIMMPLLLVDCIAVMYFTSFLDYLL